MKQLFNILIFVIALNAVASSTAQGAGPAITTLKADFVMTRKISVLKAPLTSTGKVMLAGAGRLRFETLSPSRSVIVINENKGWLHYPELGVTKQFDLSTDPVMRLMSEQLAALTSGNFAALEKTYTITDSAAGKKSLVPTAPGIKKLFKVLTVNMTSSGAVSMVEMVSANGDITTIRFENTVFNATLPSASFDTPKAQK